MSLICGLCGLELKPGEMHVHEPDVFLNVWNCRASLMRTVLDENGTMRMESLDFELPDKWLDFVLESSGGAINMSGCYRLPGIVWEWVMAKLRKDEQGARFLERRIDQFVEEHGF